MVDRSCRTCRFHDGAYCNWTPPPALVDLMYRLAALPAIQSDLDVSDLVDGTKLHYTAINHQCSEWVSEDD